MSTAHATAVESSPLPKTLRRAQFINRWVWWLFSAPLALITAAPQFLNYGSTPSVDAATFMLIGAGWAKGLVPFLNLWDDKPPLIYGLNALAAQTPDPWRCVQMMSILAAGLTALMCGWLVRQAGGDRRRQHASSFHGRANH
jgi:hypothetical protein